MTFTKVGAQMVGLAVPCQPIRPARRARERAPYLDAPYQQKPDTPQVPLSAGAAAEEWDEFSASVQIWVWALVAAYPLVWE